MASVTLNMERSNAAMGRAVVQLFQGFNTFYASAGNSALSGPSQPFGGSERLDFHVCTDFESVLQALNIDTSVSYTSPEFSASAKMDYAQSLKITVNTVTVVVYANRILHTSQATGAQLSVPVPTESGLQAFCTEYGDSWVNALTTGAEFYATYRFYAETKSEQRSVVAALKASGIAGGGKLTLSAQTALNNQSSSSQTNALTSYQLLGVSNAPLPKDDEIVNWALNTFPRLTINAPVVISFAVTGYEGISSVSPVFGPVVATRKQFSGPPTNDHALNISQQLIQVQGCSDAIDELVEAYGLYSYTSDTAMDTTTPTSKAAVVKSDLNTLTQKIQSMGMDPTTAVSWPTITSLTYGTPSANIIVTSTATIGGQGNASGGNPYDDLHDGHVPGLEDAGWRIASIMIQGGAWVDFIQVGYENAAGDSVVLQHGGGGASTVVASRLGSSPSQTLILQPEEFVSTVSGLFGHYANQLTFTTTKNQHLTWPPDPQKSTGTSQWQQPSGQSQFLIGFQGRANKYLDQLQLVCGTFSPANWS
jgi:trimeric autotransporter adhesin